jgi:serine/threonine protein kinase
VTAHGSTDRTTVARGDTGARRLPSVLGLRLRHPIGAGGEGEVWAAETPDGAVRALKLIRPDVLTDPETFAQRSHDLARIDDPALVRVHRAGVVTSGDWAGWGAMVMDLVDGSSLDRTRLGAAAFADLARLATALDRLHAGEWSQGEPLVHRDVKPANLIRTPNDEIVLVDPSSLRSVGGDMTFVGTPLFVAPEVVSGRFGPPADIYSFAATLVALHSGARGDELATLLADPWSLDIPQAVIAAMSARAEDRPGRCTDLVDPEALTVTVVSRSGGGQEARTSWRGATPSPQTSRTWWRLGLLSAAAVPLFVGLLLTMPLLAVAGVAVTAGLLALDPALRDPWLAWLPLACARWLAGSLQTDDAERDRISATVYGALLVPLLPVVGAVAGLGERLVVLGTVTQIAGVMVICGLALVWTAVVTAGRAESGLSLVRIALFPAWVAGMFALALTRVVLAVADALSPDNAGSGDAPAAGTAEREGTAQ